MIVDVAIVGGGLAGLALSIDLKKRGCFVVVIEKGNYPRHKVCGEYISMESSDYLKAICPKLAKLDLPKISHFRLSSTRGNEHNTNLDPGGFGISRYLLEELLYTEAEKIGVIFLLNNKAIDIYANANKDTYTVQTNTVSVKATLVCNSTGRNSNLDTSENHRNARNYIGIKYHIKLNRDPGLIEIHNFPGGYCGISNIEDGKSCLCYIVNSKNLNSVQNSIPEMEKQYLFKNTNLRKIFNTAEFIFNKPITVSGINFLIQEPVDKHSFFLGDAAGSIAPIAGNGMSIALRSASELSGLIALFFSNTISKQQLTENYQRFWKREFAARIKLSRHFQKLSEYPMLTNLTIGLFNAFPFLAKSAVGKTHGKPFTIKS